MTNARQLAFAALLLVAAFTWWLARTEDNSTAPIEVPRVTQPGYYLRDATLEETDDAGRLYLRVKTATADQDPVSKEIALGTVRVDYFPDGASPWLLTANHGRLPPDAHLVTLFDDVTLTGAPIAHQAPAVVRTTTMTLDTVDSTATTTAPVRIELGPQVVTATGMQANLKADRVLLTSNVHGRYVRK